MNLETILGAICIYVLIAIAFSGLYAWVNELEPTGFFAQKIQPENIDFLYFSFTTITTVGFGDLGLKGDDTFQTRAVIVCHGVTPLGIVGF